MLFRLLRGQKLDEGRADEALSRGVEVAAVVRQGWTHDLDFLAVVRDRFFGFKRGEVEEVVFIEFLAQIVIEVLALFVVGEFRRTALYKAFHPGLRAARDGGQR